MGTKEMSDSQPDHYCESIVCVQNHIRAGNNRIAIKGVTSHSAWTEMSGVLLKNGYRKDGPAKLADEMSSVFFMPGGLPNKTFSLQRWIKD